MVTPSNDLIARATEFAANYERLARGKTFAEVAASTYIANAVVLRALLDHPVIVQSALGQAYMPEHPHPRGCLFCAQERTENPFAPPADWHHAVDCVLLPWISLMRSEED